MNYFETILKCPNPTTISDFEKHPSSRMDKTCATNLKSLFEIYEKNPDSFYKGMDSKHRPFLWNYYTETITMPQGPTPPETKIIVISEFGTLRTSFTNDSSIHGILTTNKNYNNLYFIETIINQIENNLLKEKKEWVHGQFDLVIEGLGETNKRQEHSTKMEKWLPDPHDEIFQKLATMDKDHFILTSEPPRS
jgi:hypothetical protein